MKLTDFVAQFLYEHEIRTVFGVSGGASLHLLHSIYDHKDKDFKFIPNAHEQGAGFSADCYARLRGLGCAMATSGPGATNLVTAIAASFYDSVPVLYITGQVATFRQGTKYGVPFYGFQETPIVEMVRPITKYAKMVEYPSDIRWVLEKAVAISRQGRHGPVLVDIPDDLQRAEVDPDALEGWVGVEEPVSEPVPIAVFDLISNAQRPVFIWGAGMRPYSKEALLVAEHLRIPVATTWGAIDLIPFDHQLHIGGFGTHGTRAANFAVQNADLLVCIGARLDTKATGSPIEFARKAKIVLVDIDFSEIKKFEKLGRQIDIGLAMHAGQFITDLMAWVEEQKRLPARSPWFARIKKWKQDYAPKDDPSWTGTKPYALMQELAKYTTPDDIIVSDTGTALGYLMQGFPFKGERMVHAWNLTPMGYGLPAAIGAAMATGRRVILLTGDGSFLMNMSELATIRRWNLNIKIILLNNQGHAMCKQTERQWFNGRHAATTIESGLGFPDFYGVAKAFDINRSVDLDGLFSSDKADFMDVDIDTEAGLVQQARFGAPIEDMEPLLSREELEEQMQ